MLTLDIKLLENLLPEVEKRIKALAGDKVNIGMFAEQGIHAPSEFLYSNIFRYLSTGNPAKNLPPRNTLVVATQFYPLKRSPLKRGLNKYLSNLKGQPVKSKIEILNDTGVFYRERVKDVFGNPALITPKAASTQNQSNSPTTPLVETGDLKSKVAYKVNNDAPKTGL